VSAVLLVGTGQVGVRAARQLVDSPGLDHVWITSRDRSRAADLVEAMGDRASVHRSAPGRRPELPPGVTTVVVATAAPEAYRWVRSAVDAAVPVAAVVDDGFGELEVGATERGVPVVTGCGLGPGLTEVLARHAADAFDVVDEVHVARVGAAGPACTVAVQDARRETPGEWRDGAWRTDRAFGPELLWFPEPMDARECQLVRTGVAACIATVPGVRHATSRLGAPPTVGRFRRGLGRDPKDQGWGAARVEVSGWRDGTAGTLVYGVVDRTAVVAGVVLAVTGAALAGGLDAGVTAPAGVRTLGEVTTPVPFLAELGRRGVKAAAFEGVVPH
jgi:saccharopine dehydrogenase-like NADP-dependent oxidoreductase